jgi:hypothetical protein
VQSGQRTQLCLQLDKTERHTSWGFLAGRRFPIAASGVDVLLVRLSSADTCIHVCVQMREDSPKLVASAQNPSPDPASSRGAIGSRKPISIQLPSTSPFLHHLFSCIPTFQAKDNRHRQRKPRTKSGEERKKSRDGSRPIASRIRGVYPDTVVSCASRRQQTLQRALPKRR